MTERGDTQAPELWSGHSFDDDCPWEDVDESRLDRAKDFVKPLTHLLGERMIFRILQRSLKDLPKHPIEGLSYGQEFDMRLFPQGTIVKFSYDFAEGDSSESVVGEVGVINQEKEFGERCPVIIGFSPEDLIAGFQLGNTSRIYDCPIVVGEVVHTRTRSRFGEDEDLTRFNDIEIWKMSALK